MRTHGTLCCELARGAVKDSLLEASKAHWRKWKIHFNQETREQFSCIDCESVSLSSAASAAREPLAPRRARAPVAHKRKFPDTYLECFLWSCNLLVCRMTCKKEGLCVCMLCSWAASSETLAAEIVIRQQSMSFSGVFAGGKRDTLGATAKWQKSSVGQIMRTHHRG